MKQLRIEDIDFDNDDFIYIDINTVHEYDRLYVLSMKEDVYEDERFLKAMIGDDDYDDYAFYPEYKASPKKYIIPENYFERRKQ